MSVTLKPPCIAISIPSELLSDPKLMMRHVTKEAAKQGKIVVGLVQAGYTNTDFIEDRVTGIFEVKRWMPPLPASRN